MNESVNRVIPGAASLVSSVTNDDKRHVFAKDTDDAVHVFDVLEGKKIETHTDLTMQEVVDRYKTGKPLTSWFTTSIHLGSLMIDLSHSECARLEVGQTNYGVKLLTKVFYHWIKARE
jgi:hypothetical protein